MIYVLLFSLLRELGFLPSRIEKKEFFTLITGGRELLVKVFLIEKETISVEARVFLKGSIVLNQRMIIRIDVINGYAEALEFECAITGLHLKAYENGSPAPEVRGELNRYVLSWLRNLKKGSVALSELFNVI